VFLNHWACVITTCSSLSWAQLCRRALERMCCESLGHLLLLVWLACSAKPRSHSHTTEVLFILRGIVCARSSTYCQKLNLICDQSLQNKAMNQFLAANQKLGHFPQMLQLFARAVFRSKHCITSCLSSAWCLLYNCATPERCTTSAALRISEISGRLNSGYLQGKLWFWTHPQISYLRSRLSQPTWFIFHLCIEKTG